MQPHRPPERVEVTGSQATQIGNNNTQHNVFVDLTNPHGRPTPSMHNLPLPFEVFVGRELSTIDDVLAGPSGGAVVGQAAVHGLGGIGKTALATMYAWSRLARYPLVWWINAETADSVSRGLAELTGRLHPAAKLADPEGWAIGRLQATSDWLLILDNVESLDDVAPLLGKLAGRGHVLITTRRDISATRWSTWGLRLLRLDTLQRSSSVDLLMRRCPITDAAGADRLAAALGDLPLALEQAAAFINQTVKRQPCSPDDYIALLNNQFDRIAGSAAVGGASQRTVARVWDMTMASVGRRSSLAVRVLMVIGWLASDGIPLDVLAPLASDDIDLGEAVDLLCSYSMISVTGGTVSVHRLVQAVARAADDEAHSARADAARVLHAAMPEYSETSWIRWNELHPHVDAIMGHLPEDHRDTTVLDVAYFAANQRYLRGHRQVAVSQLWTVIEARLRILGAEHPDSLDAVSCLARFIERMGEAEEAATIFESVLAVRERVSGTDHPDTLRVRHHLACAYRSLGLVDRSIDLAAQVLADRRRTLGPHHSDTLASYRDLSWLLHCAERSDEAIGLLEEVLSDGQRIRSDERFDMLAFRYKAAETFCLAGRTDEAIVMYSELIEDQRRFLGAHHSAVVASLGGLAGAYFTRGDLAAAVPIFEQVHASRRSWGPDDIDTINSGRNLTMAYAVVGRWDEALSVWQQTFDDARRGLGDDHPLVREIVNDLSRFALPDDP